MFILIPIARVRFLLFAIYPPVSSDAINCLWYPLKLYKFLSVLILSTSIYTYDCYYIVTQLSDCQSLYFNDQDISHNKCWIHEFVCVRCCRPIFYCVYLTFVLRVGIAWFFSWIFTLEDDLSDVVLYFLYWSL